MDSDEGRAFRQACGQFATGVTVITVRGGGVVRGMTANSFTSVSLDPPLLAVCVARCNQTSELLGDGEGFVVNVLSRDQRDVSTRFAGHDHDHTDFSKTAHVLSRDGLPVLSGCVAHFECRVEDVFEGGDHLLVLGRVEHLQYQLGRAPLLFFGGGYRDLAPHRTLQDPRPMPDEPC